MDTKDIQASNAGLYLPSGSTGEKQRGDCLHVIETEQGVQLDLLRRFPFWLPFAFTIPQSLIYLIRYAFARAHGLHPDAIDTAIMCSLSLITGVVTMYIIERLNTGYNSVLIEHETLRLVINGKRSKIFKASSFAMIGSPNQGPYGLQLVAKAENADRDGKRKILRIPIITLHARRPVNNMGASLSDVTGLPVFPYVPVKRSHHH